MYQLSIKRVTTIFLTAVVAATVLTLSSSARGLQPTAGFVNAVPGGGRARFEVVLFRFTVNHQTWDDALERDGKGDEVSFSRVAILHNRTGSRVLSDGLNFTQTMGESPPNDLRAGHASALRGGLQTGDDIILPPVMLFSEELIQGESAATIIVSAWEMDGPRDLYQPYKFFLENHQPDMERIAMSTLGNSPQTAKLVREWDDSFTGGGGGFPATLMVLRDDPGLGEPKDRPIGMIRNGNSLYFIPKLLILNFDNATLAAQTNEGSGVGVIKINYLDDQKLAGNYTLYVKITRL